MTVNFKYWTWASDEVAFVARLSKRRQRLSILVVVLLMAGNVAVAQDSSEKNQSHAKAPGKMVDVGGRKLYLNIRGSGEPTVVFESGFRDSGQSWDSVADEIANLARVVTYDRAGIGRSDGNANGDAESPWTDLRKALHATGVEGPVILVGHSLGGLYSLGFTYRYRDRVAGIVLVDSTHEDWYAKMPAQIRKIVDRRGGSDWGKVGPVVKEMQMPLRDLPIAVLKSGRTPKVPKGVSQNDLEGLMLELSLDLAKRSTDSKHLVVEKSDHYIQRNSPEVVIAEIRRMVAAIRDRKPYKDYD